jgi:hypothetical protein
MLQARQEVLDTEPGYVLQRRCHPLNCIFNSHDFRKRALLDGQL